MTDSVNELSRQWLCCNCVGETYLASLIRAEGNESLCYNCAEVGMAITLDSLAQKIDQAFGSHYTRTASEPDAFQSAMQRDRELDYDWERDGEKTSQAIMNAAVIDEDVACDLQEILSDLYADAGASEVGEECEYDEEACYEEITPSDSGWLDSWMQFEAELKTEAQLFSRGAQRRLDAVFEGISTMKTADGQPLIVDAGPGTDLSEFFRARCFQSEPALVIALKSPDRELGPPPPRHAATGRMNARGISVFYGATKPELSRAEVRPPVGSQVAIARFTVIRRLRLLNLNALSNVHERGSIFDPHYANLLARAGFLRRLSGLMARPVMPDDQDFEYLPTQAIADYLATHETLDLDGILFPSVQTGPEGLNVVLFRKAARVETLSVPDGTEIDVDTFDSDGADAWPDFSIKWIVPPKTEAMTPKAGTGGIDFLWTRSVHDVGSDDPRHTSLKLDISSISIEFIDGVDYKTSRHRVKHYVWERTDRPVQGAHDPLPF